MKTFSVRAPVLAAVGVFSVVGFVLRLRQWPAADSSLWLDSPSSMVLFVLAGVCLLVLALLCSRSRRSKQYDAPPGPLSSIGYLAGGVLLLLLQGMELIHNGAAVASVLGCVCGAIAVWHGVLRWQGKTPLMLAGSAMVLFFIAQVISDFKDWSTDPALPDYCFKILALLCAMLGLFHVAGFSAGLGKRRIGAFWCAAGVFFCAVCLADPTAWTQRLSWVAVGLLLLQDLFWMLRPAPEEPESPPESDSPPEPEPEPES